MQKRYWLRGGFAVGGTYALLFVVYALVAYASQSSPYDPLGFGFAIAPLALSGIPATLLLMEVMNLLSVPESIFGSLLLLFIFCVAQWFLIGIFLGWLYGKIKNRSIHTT